MRPARPFARGRRALLVLVVQSALAALAPAQAPATEAEVRTWAMELVSAVRTRQVRVWERNEDLLVTRGGAAGLSQLELLHASHEYRVRILATRMAARLCSGKDIEAPECARPLRMVIDSLGDESPQVRDLAREVALELRPRAAVPALIGRLGRASTEERGEIVKTLKNLTRVPIGDAPEAWREWWADSEATFKPQPLPETGDAPAGPPDGPAYFGYTVSSRHVVFVVDQSISMSWGGRFDRARQQLAETLDGLPEDASFTVIFYGGTVRAWKSELKAARPANKKSAIRWLMEQTMIYSTATYEALDAALNVPGVDTVYLLSDGDPNVGRYTRTDDICREVRADNTFLRVKIFTIGFFFGEVPPEYQDQARDTSSTREFMRRLAAENRGHFAEIEK